MGLATINIKFQADLTGFSSEMQNSMRRIGAFGNQMSAIGKGMSLYLTAPIIGAGAAAIKFASDYDESLNKVDVAFKDSAESVKRFGDTSLESFGIAKGTALDMASTYGDMGTSLGLTTDKAAKMSTSLVGLAGDLSSFKNISIDIANTALTGIFSGETESLKKLGIVMTEANLQNFAFSQGIRTKIADMDQASKVNLRYAYIMSVTKNAQGDFARTGGSASNQMRIFQESLKQVAQQFGSIMIPAFTKAIVYVNELIKSFGSLTEGTKTTIVVIAAVVAATGPLLTVFGSMLTFVPNLISKFNALKTTLQGMQAVILANPYTALAVAIGLIAAATYGWYVNSKSAVTAQESLNKAVADGSKNAAAEVGALDKLFAAATNVKGSITETKEAREKLQELYPAYFKNLDAESIKNGTAKIAYNELRDAIFAKSRAMAIDNQLQENANNRIAKEIELQEKIAIARKKYAEAVKKGDKAATISTTGEGVDFATQKSGADVRADAAKYLKATKTELEQFYADSKKQDAVLLAAKQEYSTKTVKLLENEVAKTNAVTGALEGVAEGIEKVKKANLEPIDIKISTSATSGSANSYDEQIAKLREFQTQVATTADQVKMAETAIKQIDLAKAMKFDPASLIQVSGGFEKLQLDMQAKAVGITASLNSINESARLLTENVANAALPALTDAFSQMGDGIISSLGLAKNGFQGFIGGLLQTVTKLIAMMLASSISQSIAGATSSGTATGPAAIFTTPAFIATAVAGVIAAFAAIPKFEYGGVVGGSSYYGDKIMARVNSAEMISNTDQQKRIWGAMNSGGSSSTVIPDIRIQGQDLLVVFERAQNRKSRTS